VTQLRSLLVLLPGHGIGGAELHTLEIVRAAASLGVRVALAAEPAFVAPLAARLGRLPGLTLHPAPGLGWSPEQFHESPVEQARATSRLLEETAPDAALLPLPWPTAGIGPRRALAAAEVPSLLVGHLVPLDGDANAVRALGGFAAGPGRVVAVSAPAAGRLAAAYGLASGQVGVVPNGVVVPPEDPAARAEARLFKRYWLNLPPDAPMLVFAGRLDKQKGADLLPALALALWQRRGATVVALGQGEMLEQLSGLGEPLRLPGQVADVPDWLLAADALLMPSRLEGCPLTFLEAAARRCPVLASRAALECLEDRAGEMATLLDLEDPGALLADACAGFPPGPRGAQQVAAAWRHAAQFDQAAMLRRYLGLLRGLVA
jgi:glycosyltransferase involved in cell wall biosynthesis